MTASPPLKTPILSRVVAGVLLLILGGALTIQLSLFRQTEIENAERMVYSMALAIEQNVGGSIRNVDAFLMDMAAAVQAGSWNDPESLLRFEGRLSAFPEVIWVGIASPDGKMQTYTPLSFISATRNVNVADRDYFSVFAHGDPLAGNGGTLHIGEPVIGRLTSERSIHLSRAVIKNGTLQAVVVAAIAADIYAQQLDTTLLDPNGANAIIRMDGFMMARAPAHAQKFGLNISNSDLFTKRLPQKKVGIAHLIAKTDGNNKILAYRQLDRYPLVVTSGISLTKALANWYNMTTVAVGGFLFFSLVVAYWASMSDLRNGALLRHRDTLQHAVAERTIDLERAKMIAERRAEDIESLNSKLSRLAQLAAHDLQEPVRRMVSFSQLLRRRLTALSEDAEADLRFIEDGGKRLKATLEGFRQYTELLGTTPRFETVPLADCVASALSVHQADIVASNSSIILDHLPVILADRSLLALAITRLIDNAWKYRATDRPTEIVISGKQDQNGWSVSVTDNGQGLPPDLEEAFASFTPGPQQSGMGLAFCQAVAEIHGGQLTAERLPQGTRFTLTAQHPIH